MPSQSYLRAQTSWIAFLDVLCLVAGCSAGVLSYFWLTNATAADVSEYVLNHMAGWLVFIGSMILANYLAGSYRIQYTFSRFNIVVTWFFSLVFAVLVLAITSYAWFFDFLLGRGVLLLSVGWYSVISLILKMLAYRGLFRSDLFLCRTVVVGRGDYGKAIRRMVENEFVLPAHKVVAYIDLDEGMNHGGTEARRGELHESKYSEDDSPIPATLRREDTERRHDPVSSIEHPASSIEEPASDGHPLYDGVVLVKTSLEGFSDIISSLGVNLIVLSFPRLDCPSELYPSLRRLRFEGIEVLGALGVAEIYQGRTPLAFIDQESLLRMSLESGLPWVKRFKRLFDIVASLVGILVFLPIAGVIAALTKLTSPKDPIVYSQSRVGLFGRVFNIYKFRTMVPGAEDGTGAVWAASDDRRVTGLGRVLRRFRLDEILQFVNVLRGEMSLVGPRPERPELVEKLEREVPFFDERLNAMPGLTGWAQIRYPYGSSLEDAKRKLEYDLYYIQHFSVSLDLQIILQTLRVVIMGKEREI